jgi:hypothetical protein
MIFIIPKIVNIIPKVLQKCYKSVTKVLHQNIYIWRERNFSQSSKTLKNECI